MSFGLPALRHWLFLVFMLSVIAGVTGLGVWQTQRASQRDARDELHQQRQQLPAFTPDSAAFPAVSALIGRRVRLTGKFDNQQYFRVGNIVHDGKQGVMAVMPFVISEGAEDGTIVFVIAGWAERKHRAKITPRQDGAMRIEGWVRKPQRGTRLSDWLLPDRDAATSWFLYLDWAGMADALPRHGAPRIAPFYLHLDRPPPSQPALQAMQPPDAYRIPHENYARTWFGLAIVLSGCLVVYGLRSRSRQRR